MSQFLLHRCQQSRMIRQIEQLTLIIFVFEEEKKGNKYYLQKIIDGNWKKGTMPELWDGQTANRIVEKLTLIYENV